MYGNLEISTIIGCSMRCSYCPQASHVKNYTAKSKDTLMSFSNFQKYISTVPKEVDIVFAGMAEPFLNPLCIEMMRGASWRHKLSLYTTGMGVKISDTLSLKILKEQNCFNHFCLHLPDAEGKMKLNVTDEYLRIIHLLKPLANNFMCIGTLHPQVKDVLGFDVPSGEHGLYSRGGSISHLAIPRKTGQLKCSACTDNLNHNVLLPNGDVLLCCMDYNQNHVIGNLNNMKYADIFVSEEYKKVKQGLLDESIDILCRHCEVSSKL